MKNVLFAFTVALLILLVVYPLTFASQTTAKVTERVDSTVAYSPYL